MSIKIYLLSHCSKVANALLQRTKGKAKGRSAGDQRGFSMLELILYAAIVGILVSVAAPKYNNAMASANTARVQSDMQTIDSAIAMYIAEKGATPSEVKDLSEYIVNASGIKPPASGKMYINGDIGDIPAKVYTIAKDSNGDTRANLNGQTVSYYSKDKTVTA